MNLPGHFGTVFLLVPKREKRKGEETTKVLYFHCSCSLYGACQSLDSLSLFSHSSSPLGLYFPPEFSLYFFSSTLPLSTFSIPFTASSVLNAPQSQLLHQTARQPGRKSQAANGCHGMLMPPSLHHALLSARQFLCLALGTPTVASVSVSIYSAIQQKNRGLEAKQTHLDLNHMSYQLLAMRPQASHIIFAA